MGTVVPFKWVIIEAAKYAGHSTIKCPYWIARSVPTSQLRQYKAGGRNILIVVCLLRHQEAAGLGGQHVLSARSTTRFLRYFSVFSWRTVITIREGIQTVTLKVFHRSCYLKTVPGKLLLSATKHAGGKCTPREVLNNFDAELIREGSQPFPKRLFNTPSAAKWCLPQRNVFVPKQDLTFKYLSLRTHLLPR